VNERLAKADDALGLFAVEALRVRANMVLAKSYEERWEECEE
jgi:hypothetical protein